ncbi:BBX [Acanthosepion pharaonis]|uniref:BBX n=1 Tax=Acanthosepion pharaonis TaxID=158019 RepID=A0A812CPW5_ACAPH|nr:BBX [Sepia pharaonis]
MNSFFIFCKRHRSMVRDYHHNLDNRSISRILGELWATLDPKQKQQYTATAKQYKDAFLKANPDYKWHNNDKSHLMSTNNYALNQELTDPDKNNEKNSSPSTSSPTHTSKDGNESDGSKSHQSDASGDVNWTKISGFDNCRQADYIYREVHVPTRKSKRTNKGAIYKNLIATGALPASRERLAEIQTIYNVNSDDGSEIKETPFHEQPIRRIKRTASESDTHPDKRYKTGDFDLDAKIATLPACSMDVLEKNRKNVTRPKSSPENSRRSSGGISTHVMKTDMLLAPPRRQRHPVSSPIIGSRKRKQSKDSIMRIVPLSEEYRHRLSCK